MAGMIGKKHGMTRYFVASGEQVPVTVIELGPNRVVGKRTQETDKYTALRLGFGERTDKHINKPMAGEYKQLGAKAAKVVREFRVDAAELARFEVGQLVTADMFAVGQKVDVTGLTRGKGFAGVVKKFKVGGGIEGRGTHEYYRHIGAIGQRKTPGRVFKNKKMPGHRGVQVRTAQNLEVVAVDVENNLLLVKGGVAGHKNAIVIVRPTVKPAKVTKA
jgi:large subunit ribosomal protein L3